MSKKGYKAFDKDLKCRDYQFEIGKTYEHEGEFEPCKSGFHFCEKTTDVFEYYSWRLETRVCEVEAVGEVKSEGNKSVTNKILIGRELTRDEILMLCNIGKSNTGLNNTGDQNTGHHNTGYQNTGHQNTGHHNTGDQNTGHWNTGDHNTGNHNTGNQNTGYHNTGNQNTGHQNTGDQNTADRNTGNWNTGYWNNGDQNTGDQNTGNQNTGYQNTGDQNTGHHNTGNQNTGHRNTGDQNTGHHNTGHWNTGNRNTGFFNTTEPTVRLFNQQTEISFNDPRIQAVQDLSPTYVEWVDSVSMTDAEKAAYPTHTTTGGYLKTIPYKEAWLTFWTQASDEIRDRFKALPFFDAAIFEEVTGISVNDPKWTKR